MKEDLGKFGFNKVVIGRTGGPAKIGLTGFVRNEADYDPGPLRLKRSDVKLLIDEAEVAIDDFVDRAPVAQRRALAFACIVPKRRGD